MVSTVRLSLAIASKISFRPVKILRQVGRYG